MRETARRRRRSQGRRGGATVEAVILLPVLAVLLSGLFFVHAHASGRQHARAEARRCAWLHAVDGCKDVPPDCEGLVHGSDRASSVAEADAAATEVKNHAADGDLLDAVPLIGPALDGLVGSATEFSASHEIQRAGLHGTAVGGVHLLCDAKPLDPWTAVETTFCESTSLCP